MEYPDLYFRIEKSYTKRGLYFLAFSTNSKYKCFYVDIQFLLDRIIDELLLDSDALLLDNIDAEDNNIEWLDCYNILEQLLGATQSNLLYEKDQINIMAKKNGWTKLKNRKEFQFSIKMEFL